MFVNNIVCEVFLNVIYCINVMLFSSVTYRYFVDIMLLINQINRLPPEVVKYFTDPDAIEAPDMELLFPFVESALPLAYGVLGVLLFHVSIHSYIFLAFVHIIAINDFSVCYIGVCFIQGA